MVLYTLPTQKLEFEKSLDKEGEQTLSNFESRCDVTHGRLHVCFTMIPYTKHEFHGNSLQIHNDITSNLKVGQQLLGWLLILLHNLLS